MHVSVNTRRKCDQFPEGYREELYSNRDGHGDHSADRSRLDIGRRQVSPKDQIDKPAAKVKEIQKERIATLKMMAEMITKSVQDSGCID
jgi:hypothetical protein